MQKWGKIDVVSAVCEEKMSGEFKLSEKVVFATLFRGVLPDTPNLWPDSWVGSGRDGLIP